MRTGISGKAEIGAENVFDFSIGNPSVPAPENSLYNFIVRKLHVRKSAEK